MVQEFCQVEKVEFLDLQETISSGDHRLKVKSLWGMDEFGFVQQDAIGLSRGLLNIWNTNVFQLLEHFASYGYLGVSGLWNRCTEQVNLVNIYASQVQEQKQVLWVELKKEVGKRSGIWILLGALML